MNCFVCLVAALMVALNASAATVQIDPPQIDAGLTQTLDLSARIVNVDDLYAYQFDIFYDTDILDALSVSEGAFLSGGGGTFFRAGIIDDATGTITGTANTLLGPSPGVSGSGTLATISFLVRGGPNQFGQVTPSNIILLSSAGADIPADVQSGVVRVIPEPNPGLLLGTAAALGLLVHRWRSTTRPQSGPGTALSSSNPWPNPLASSDPALRSTTQTRRRAHSVPPVW